MNAESWNLGLSAKRRLVDRLRRGNAVVSFTHDPALAALCTCLALKHEVGNREFDRLSPFFGVLLPKLNENPWESEIFVKAEELGIRFRRRDGGLLTVRHEEFAHLLAPESLNERGELFQAVIYPARVATHFRTRGFELVIVRDWILASALQLEEGATVSYLVANEWEIRQNIARTQVALMLNHELPFFGTHDIVDHLLGADLEKYDGYRDLFCRVRATLDRAPGQLVLSYFIGVLLDDLAQPRWYGSVPHGQLLRAALAAHERSHPPGREQDSTFSRLPDSFHALVDALRSGKGSIAALQIRFELFLHDLHADCSNGPRPVQFSG